MERTTCTEHGCRFRLAELTVGDEVVCDLMDMGDVMGPNGETITLYKHYETRRYLNLSAAGDSVQAWTYTTVAGERAYVPADVDAAVLWVIG